ncbi:flagellar hook-length control protein FliK [Pseudoalteromonas sp. BDTF-M6]|uniref:flagellar hook-length control protein FliK n=1 Tax=Pseudoalteromonas sp. BDTF-M6 TaxID=2796132 RepID=UPI001BB00E13|nr:flagellar hook-length control protein FliK [Pseudoalteromonas sp. BDTF-M6]MBS3798813.1 flagellar hook-length control protein FliK [Pseudoalteromonas sp. BDTF-M6]
MTYIESVAMLGTQVISGDSASSHTKGAGDEVFRSDSSQEQAPSFASAYQQAQDAASKSKVDAKAKPEASPDTSAKALPQTSSPKASDEKTNIDLAEEKDAALTVPSMDAEETLANEEQVLSSGDKSDAELGAGASAGASAGADTQSKPNQAALADHTHASQAAQQLTTQGGEQGQAGGDFYQQLFAQLTISTELKTAAHSVSARGAEAMGAKGIEIKALAPDLQQALAKLTPQQKEQLNATVLQLAQEQNLEPKQLAALTQQLEGWAKRSPEGPLLGDQGEGKETGSPARLESGKMDELLTKPMQSATAAALESKNSVLASGIHVTMTSTAGATAGATASKSSELNAGVEHDLLALSEGNEQAAGVKISQELGLESAPKGRLESIEGGKISQLAQALLAQLSGGTHAGAASDVGSAIEADLAQWQQFVSPASVQAQTAAQGTGSKQTLDPALLQALNITKSDAAQQLHQRVNMLLNLSNQEAEIRLDPPELGSMQVRVRSEGEQAHINFVVQNQQAKEALEQSMPRLRELLAQQGLALGEAQVEQQNQGQGHEREAFANQAQQGLEAEVQGDSEAELEPLSGPVKNPQAEQGIDFYA